MLIGQLRARSTELQEDELVSESDAATKWIVAGPGALSQKADASEFSYDFSSDSKVTLSQTFTTSFPIERLRRLQFYFQPDDSWHALRMTVEKLGHRFVSERAIYLADHNWQVATWQEPSAGGLADQNQNLDATKGCRAIGDSWPERNQGYAGTISHQRDGRVAGKNLA